MNINDMSVPELEANLQDLINECVEKGKRWAFTKSVYEDYDDKRKVVHARCMEEFVGSTTEREKRAYTHDLYAEFLEGMALARGEYFLAQVEWDLWRLKIDSMRTIISTRREEIKRFQG